MEDSAVNDIEKIGENYYLFTFTNTELIDVLVKADEWSAFDVQLARKLLAERGESLSDDAVKKIHEERIAELKLPEPSQRFWIVIGYICAFMGGVLGLFIGWHVLTYKKTLPNGERVLITMKATTKTGSGYSMFQ